MDIEVIVDGQRLGSIFETTKGRFGASDLDGQFLGYFSTAERAIEELEWWENFGEAA